MDFTKNLAKNTRYLLAVLFCSICFTSFGQKIEDQLKAINSLDEANYFIETNDNIQAEVWTIIPEIDHEGPSKIFKDKKIGAIFSDSNAIYKVIDSKNTTVLRVSYIFLDGNKMSLKSINDLRKKILEKYKKGIPFADLANQYTMDSSKNGDLNWFTEGTMVKEFETAIRNHSLNDIFTIDLDKEKWYYVTLKTFQDQKVEELTILKVKS